MPRAKFIVAVLGLVFCCSQARAADDCTFLLEGEHSVEGVRIALANRYTVDSVEYLGVLEQSIELFGRVYGFKDAFYALTESKETIEPPKRAGWFRRASRAVVEKREHLVRVDDLSRIFVYDRDDLVYRVEPLQRMLRQEIFHARDFPECLDRLRQESKNWLFYYE